MATEQNFLATIDPLDIYEYNQDFQDLRYVGKNSKNTILHLMGMATFKFDSYKPKIIKILSDKSIDVNRLNNRKRTCIIEALKYRNYEFVKLVIENSDIDLSKRDDKDIDAFDFACSDDQPDIANMILDHFKNVKTSYINNITNKDERGKIGFRIYANLSIPKLPHSTDDPNFKIYNENEFIIKTNSTNISGSYGVINIATEKSTGKDVVVKRFRNIIKDKYFTDDIIRDVCFLKTLNRYGTSTKVYGMMYDSKENIYMVMESLDKTLTDKIILIYTLSKNIREIGFLELIKDVLVCIDVNSKVGIIHCDTKENNMMTDNELRTRYIDYGFSYFLGISPFISNVDKEIHNGSYLSSDGDENISSVVDYYDYFNIKNKLFSIKKGFTGLNLDIPSVAFMILSQTIRKTDSLYGVHDGTIYTDILHIKGTNNFSVNSINSNRIKNDMLNAFGVTVTEILMKMMEIDPNTRPTARELLNSHYFKMKELVVPKNIELLPVIFPKTDSRAAKIIYSMAKKYDSISTEQYLRGGFIYYDDIYDHWKDVEITLVRSTPKLSTFFADALAFANSHGISFDTFYASIYYIYNFSIDEASVNDIYPKFLYVMMSYSKLFEDSYLDQDILIKETMSYSKCDKDQALNFCKNMFDIIKNDVRFFNIKPTMVFVNYIKFILMSTCNDSAIIGDIMGRFQIALYEFITRQTGNNVTGKISNIVKKIYDDLPNNIPFNIPEQSAYRIENSHIYHS